MKISIHMPAFNAEATIASALKSLLRQRDAGRLDIIVVDDGSTDGTCDVVAALAATAPEIRLIRLAHGGISNARNTALRAMAPDTDLVTFLDADDLSPEGRLARDVRVFEADPALQLVYSKVRFFDREDTERLAPCISSHVVDGRVMQLGAAVFRRQLLDDVGLFEEGLLQAEDTDYLLRVLERRPRLLQLDEVGVYYRKNHGGISDDRQQAPQEIAKAVLRARKRRAQLGDFQLPQGMFTTDHMPELGKWLRYSD
jgi:glycosyltransferase involved in cell wall biosynthesis